MIGQPYFDLSQVNHSYRYSIDGIPLNLTAVNGNPRYDLTDLCDEVTGYECGLYSTKGGRLKDRISFYTVGLTY